MPNARFERFVARHLGRPTGTAGRFLFAPMLNRMNRAQNEGVLRALDIQRGHHALDIGFGGGVLLRRMLETEAGLVIGVDPSEDMVERAARQLRGAVRDGRLALHHGFAEGLPLPTETVDAVSAVNVIYFWPDMAPGLAEILRVLRPGGRFVVGHVAIEAMREMPPPTKHGFHLRELHTIEGALRDAGFTGVVTTTTSPARGSEHTTVAFKP